VLVITRTYGYPVATLGLSHELSFSDHLPIDVYAQNYARTERLNLASTFASGALGNPVLLELWSCFAGAIAALTGLSLLESYALARSDRIMQIWVGSDHLIAGILFCLLFFLECLNGVFDAHDFS
jgi:hypothetical protein